MLGCVFLEAREVNLNDATLAQWPLILLTLLAMSLCWALAGLRLFHGQSLFPSEPTRPGFLGCVRDCGAGASLHGRKLCHQLCPYRTHRADRLARDR